MIRALSSAVIAALALTLAPAAPALAGQTGTTAATATATAAHARFTVETTGQGADVILIPGLSSPRAVWDGAKGDLASGHRLHLIQIRGFGGDDAGPNLSGPLLDQTVDQIAAYIRDNKLQHPAVVGHSMGGLIGLMLAERHPDLVGRLMVVDALPFIGVLFAPGATVDAIAPQAAAMRDQMAAAYGKPANPAVARQIAATNALKPASREQVAKWVEAADPRVSAIALYEDMTTDLRPRIAAIAAPVTVVYPYSDFLPQARADAVYRGAYAAMPHVSFAPVGDSGHFVMLDQPQAFAAALNAFLAD